MLFVSHDRRFLAALSNRVLELTPEGVRPYGGGYTEYVTRAGHEAPGGGGTSDIGETCTRTFDCKSGLVCE